MKIKSLIKEWEQYKKDPKVLYGLNPPLGIVFTFEGFWQWLLEKEISKKGKKQ